MTVKIIQSIKKDFFDKTVVHILLIAAIGFFAYSNTFNVPFQWDEEAFLGANPIIRNLNYFLHPSRAAGLPFYDAFIGRYIGYLTFAINYRFHELSVPGFHIVNLAIHIINAVLVYFFVLVTFRSPFLRDSRLAGNSKFVALAAAMLFVAHPVQTEAVTYIFQRLASLVTLFYLLSIVSYAYSRISVNVKRKYVLYTISILSAVAAMKTKENAFTLPVVIVLYEFLFFDGGIKKRIVRLVPILLTLFIIPLTIVATNKPLHQIMHQVATADVGAPEIPRWPYLFTQFRVIVTYLRLLILPVNQNLDYDYHLYKSFFDPQVILSFLFLAALCGLGVYMIKQAKVEVKVENEVKENKTLSIPQTIAQPAFRLIGFGILWFFITLSVESSIIPIPVLIDEYRMYLPSVGFFFALSAAMFLFARKIKLENRMMILLFSLIIAALFGLTYVRNAVWFDRFTLWEDVVEKSPNNVRAYNNLGTGYLGINENEKAIEMLNKAISLKPDYMLAYHNRGEAYIKEKDYDRALKDFKEADSLQRNYLTYVGMGKAYFGKGDSKLALENFLKAVVMKPDSEKALSGIAFFYAQNGEYGEAIRLYTKILDSNHYDPDIYLNRGKVYMAQKDYAKAASDYAAAARLNPTYLDAVYNCALAYYYAGQYDSSIREYSRAIALNAGSPVLYEGRGLSFYSKKDIGRAIADFTKTIELNPKYALVYSNRGLAWSEIKRFDLAIADFTRAIEIRPDFSGAYMNRGVAYKMTGSIKQALKDFNKALSLDHNLAAAYTNRGDLYLESGKKAKAVIDFKRGCVLKDSNSCARLLPLVPSSKRE